MSRTPNDTTEEGLINFSSQRHVQRSSNRDRPTLFQQSSGREQEDLLRGWDSPFMHRGESSPFPSAGASAGRQSIVDQKEKSDKLQSKEEKEGLEIEKSLKQDVKRMSLIQIIFSMKLKLLAQRMVHQLKSRMYLNLTPFQYRLIDDKSYVQQNGLSALINHRNRTNSIVKSRNSFGNGDDNKRALTLKNLKGEQTYMPDYQEQESEESNYLLIRIIQRTLCSLEAQKFFHQLSLSIPLFHPSSIFKIFWDFASMCLIVFFLIMIPIYITFFDQINTTLNHLVIILAPCYVFVDTLISINSSYYEKGLLIKRRRFIIANYWKKYSATEFFIITVSIIHLLQVYEKNSHSWTRFLLLVFVLKIQNCASIFRKFEELFISRRSHQIMDLMKLISVIMIIGHFISCLWLLIAQFEEQIGEEKTWISVRIFSGNEWSYRYIEAFYFSMVTMVTVGYGDVLPITPIEKTTCVILMLVSCGIFAYSMNTIGHILENFNQEELIISKKMHIVNTYMSNKNVNKRMQYAIREYLDYYWREASERDQEAEEKIIGQLSDQLRENLLIEANKIVLKQSSVFRKNFSARIKQRMIPLIREYRCTPEEIICSEGDVDDSSIFFIEKGSVQFFIDTSDGTSQTKQTPLITLRQGDSFGELSFFTGLPRCSSVRSKEFTTLLMIKRENFIDLLKQFPEDFEQFMAIKDSLCLYEDYQILDMHCYSCGSSQHLVYHCPFIHMKSNVEKIIFSYNKSPNQERKTYERIRKRKQNSIAGGIEYYLECARELASLNNDHPNVVMYVEQNPNLYQKSLQNSKVKLSAPLLSNDAFDKDSLTSSSSSQSGEDNKTSVSMRNQQQFSVKRRSKFVNSITDSELSMEISKQQLQHNQPTPPVSMSISEEYSPQQNQFSKDSFNQQGQRTKSRRVTNLLQMAEVKEEEEGEERSHQNNNNMIPRRRSMYYDDGHQQQQPQSSSISNPLYGKYFQEEPNLATSQGTTPSNNLRHVAHSQNTAPRLESSMISKTNPFFVQAQLPPQVVRARNNSLQNQVAELLSILRGILPSNNSKNSRIPRFTAQTNPTANSINSNLSIQMVPLRRGSKFISSTSQTPSNMEYFKLQTEDTTDQQNNLPQILSSGEFCENMPNFDVMKNFEIYFPFNNLVYQLKLMSTNREEKRRKMLRSHFMNQQTMKCHVDSPMTTISRFGNNNNNMYSSRSSIQKVVIKYQREMEEQENQTVSDLKKSKFHTSTRIGQGPPVDSSIEGSSTFKTLNLINLHRNSASMSAGLKTSNKLSSNFKDQTSLNDGLKNATPKQQHYQHTVSLESSSEQANIPQSIMFPSSNDQIFKDPLLSIDLHSDIFKVLTDTGQKSNNLVDKEEDPKNGIHFIQSMLFNQDQRNSKSISSVKQHSFDRNESNNFQGFLLTHHHSENLQQYDQYNDSILKELSPISNQKIKKQDDTVNQEFESFNIFDQSDTSIQNINEINNLSLAHKPKKRPLVIHPIIENQSSSSVDN